MSVVFVDTDSGTIVNGPIYLVDLPDNDLPMTDQEVIEYAEAYGAMVAFVDITEAPEPWEWTHVSARDSSPARLVSVNDDGTVTMENEDGVQWTDPADQWVEA